ncbi:response regulator [bacterium]|nr:response regulator [bacterium]
MSKGLISHTVVIVVGKRERAIAMETLLKKMGCNVIVALSLYDALKFVVQEMPHMVVTESELPDGSAASLYDRLEAHPTLKDTPIVVNVLKKTREVLQELSKRKFAGFFLGKFDPKMFLRKTIEVLMDPTKPSPYYTNLQSIGVDGKFNLSFTGKVIGKTDEQLVIKSNMEVDAQASLVCVPEDKKYSPMLVRQGSNLQDEEGVVNLFPLGKISGKGRMWLPEIPDYNTAASAPSRRMILFYDPSEERFNQFEEILKGYDIEAVHASSLKRAVSFLRQRGDSFGAVYLYELMNDSSSIEWKKAYDALPEATRPPMLVGTTSINVRDTAQTKYIRRPFGLGVFIETLQSCFERVSDINDQAIQTGFVGLDIRFQAPATLVGVDEIGGIIQVKFPVVAGAKIDIPHDVISSINSEASSVQIVNVAKVEGEADIWQIRFSMVDAGGSKSKHFESVAKVVASLKEEAREEMGMSGELEAG